MLTILVFYNMLTVTLNILCSADPYMFFQTNILLDGVYAAVTLYVIWHEHFVVAMNHC